MAYRPVFYGGLTGNTGGNTAFGTGSYFLAGGNNVTLSQSTNANGSTISMNAGAQSNQVLSLSALGNTTQTSTGTMNATNMNLSGAGIVSVGYPSGGSAVISATQSGQAFSAQGGSSAFQTLSFSNANGMSFSNNAGQIQGSYTVPTVTNSSMTMQAGASTLSSVSRVAFGDGNGISFGASTSNNGSITITGTVATTYAASNHSHGNPTLNLTNLSGTTASASNGLTLSLSAANPGLTTARASTDAIGLNTAGTNMTWTANSSGLSINAAGYAGTGFSGTNVSGTVNSNGVQLSANAGGGAALSAAGNSVSNGTVVFSNSNGVGFGMAGSTITASHNALTTARASNDAIGLNTAGTNVTWTANSSGLSFNGAGYAGTGFSGTNATGTIDSNGLQLSVGAGGGGGGGVALSAGGALYSSGTLNFSNAGGALTLSTNPSSVLNMSVPTVSSLSASGAISLSTNGNTISIGAPATSSLVGVNLTLSTSQSTISISGPAMFDVGVSASVAGGSVIGGSTGNTGGLVLYAGSNITMSQATDAGANASVTISAAGGGGGGGATLSTWEPWPVHNTGTAALSANLNTSSPMSLIPFVVPANVAAGRLQVLQTYSFISGGTSSFSQSATQNYGLYTRGTGASSTTLSQVISGSWSYGVSYNNSSMSVSYPNQTDNSSVTYTSTGSAGVALSASFNGLRLVNLPLSYTLSPGVYWLGLLDRQSYAGFSSSGIRQSYYGNAMTLTSAPPLGAALSTSGTIMVGGMENWMPGFGSYTSGAGQTAMPNTVALSGVSHALTVIPYMKFVST